MMTNPMLHGHESVLLSAMMNGSRDLAVTIEDFFSPANRIIFATIAGLENRSHLAVTDALRGRLDEVGGESRLLEIRSLPTDKLNVDYALECVLDGSRERQATKIGARLESGDITPGQAEEQLSQLNERRRDLPPIVDMAEAIANPIVLPDDVIQGVLHRGAKMVLGGGSKSFKTWTLIDLVASTTTGTDWMGKFPTTRGRVLYINLELQEGWFAKRVQSVCNEAQITLEPGWFTAWNLRGYAADLSKLLPRILRGIKRDEYALIVLDPIYKLLGARDENKAGDIATLLNEMELLAVKTGAAVAFGAHFSKGNQSQKTSMDRIGGSGVFARDPDTIITFTHHEEEDCFTVDATLRNHPPIAPFVVRWEFPMMCADLSLDPKKLKPVGRPEIHRAKDLLLLIDRPMSATEIVEMAHEEIGVDRRRVFELLRELKAAGLLKQPEKRGKYEPV